MGPNCSNCTSSCRLFSMIPMQVCTMITSHAAWTLQAERTVRTSTWNPGSVCQILYFFLFCQNSVLLEDLDQACSVLSGLGICFPALLTFPGQTAWFWRFCVSASLNYIHRHFTNKFPCLHLLTGCFTNKVPCPHLAAQAATTQPGLLCLFLPYE